MTDTLHTGLMKDCHRGKLIDISIMKRLHKGGESEENTLLSEIKPFIFVLIKFGAKHKWCVTAWAPEENAFLYLFSVSVVKFINPSGFSYFLVFLPFTLSSNSRPSTRFN